MQTHSIAARLSRRVFLSTLGVVPAAMIMLSLNACNTGLRPDGYTFSQHQVQTAIQRWFPYQHSVEHVFDVTLANPAVTLLPERNCLAVQLDVQLVSPLLRQPVNGMFTVSSALAWDAAHHAVVLHAPSVDDVHLDGGAAAYTQQVKAVLAPAVTKLLADYPVYTLKPDQLHWLANYQPGDITVLANGVHVKLVAK